MYYFQGHIIAMLLTLLQLEKIIFTKRYQFKVDVVRRFQHAAEVPSNETVIQAVESNTTKNKPITRRDALMSD